MNLSISYRHLDSSESVSKKIEEKVQHLKKYYQGAMNISWVCSVDGHDQHTSEVQVSVDNNQFHAHAVDSNLYATLDAAIAKLEKQMSKESEKKKRRIH
ncbi:MAG: ribosome-associated translation inhibitor RaiA [Bacteriovoracaceae bacterium]|jgi:putative sigma-54 modulation protein|nr:ribosomal subunit interface protein [Halobacteriovoraceae bacterium]MDP7320608.1 ribosome-associated translation inhibitor RaiA [Bacteriovoracaceae bacterium]|tara:strand:- start:221 stop:517 length:297 start_codon:yes stop_codon:yes gene_type:complete